ncbi:hypothetical protein MVEN_00648200 [Mycena venus]|uniref:Mid2 domain-containing protein n=1 Tax=Mycena venus TaxID=2733690 RepID=A0A8H7D8T2_9AGAR|nr:hypothetical protein MVEN_00648200 [Mycena venus]
MTLLPLSLISFFGLSVSAAGLRDVISSQAPTDDSISQETSSEPVSTILWRRTARLDRSTTIAVSVGTIGGVAIIAAIFLGLLLVLRIRRDRRKLASDQKVVYFPDFLDNPASYSKERPYASENVPPRSSSQFRALSLDNAKSAWFIEEGERAFTWNPHGRQPTSRETSLQELIPPSPAATHTPSRTALRQEIIPDRNPSPAGIPVENSTIQTPTAIQPRTPRSASEVTFAFQASQGLPPSPRPIRSPKPEPEPESPPSFIVSHQLPQPESVILRPRRSSLRGSRPNWIITVPSPGHHVTSASDDIMRPVSRFNISPVGRSFPSRRTPSSARMATRYVRRPGGFDSPSKLANLQLNDATPDVPSDIHLDD